jgi:hypothetical protein
MTDPSLGWSADKGCLVLILRLLQRFTAAVALIITCNYKVAFRKHIGLSVLF